MRLDNKVAVVTGGASGIGRVLAGGLAAEGAKIVIADIDPEKSGQAVSELVSRGAKALAVQTDVSEKDRVKAMVRTAVETYGKIDLLVCCTAVKEYHSLENLTIEDWDRTLAVNVRGVFLTVQAVAAEMVRQEIKGNIIVMNSLAAYRGRRHQIAYSASKASLLAFVGNAALQLGKYGIRVNGLAPGILDVEDPEIMEDKAYKADHIPMKRLGKAEDLIGPVVFLATEESAYISGETIKVDGAFSQRVSGCDI